MQDLRLPRKGPTAEAIVCLGDRVIRIPSAAKPRDLNSQLSNLNSQLFLSCLERNSRFAAVFRWMDSRANGRGLPAASS